MRSTYLGCARRYTTERKRCGDTRGRKKQARKPTANGQNKMKEEAKQKILHFHHSHLEAKGNRWYNLKNCMKIKPRQLKKSFSDIKKRKSPHDNYMNLNTDYLYMFAQYRKWRFQSFRSLIAGKNISRRIYYV